MAKPPSLKWEIRNLARSGWAIINPQGQIVEVVPTWNYAIKRIEEHILISEPA